MGEGVNFADVELNYVRKKIHAEFRWNAYDSFSPVNPLRAPLTDCRVAFVTTAGAHLRDQPRFNIEANEGDPSYRAFPSGTALADLELTHRGYDTRRADADKNVVLPLEHLESMEEEGLIGALAPTVYSFMGYVAETAVLVHQTAPEVADRLLAEDVDLVLLAPT